MVFVHVWVGDMSKVSDIIKLPSFIFSYGARDVFIPFSQTTINMINVYFKFVL